jgi:hypothetical protein
MCFIPTKRFGQPAAKPTGGSLVRSTWPSCSLLNRSALRHLPPWGTTAAIPRFNGRSLYWESESLGV